MESPCHRGTELRSRSREAGVGKKKKVVDYFVCRGCGMEYDKETASTLLNKQKAALKNRQNQLPSGR